ncbi:Transcriptional regulator, winged helix family [Nostocoides japonicum T1-X7]|uniref:Transcriptional regulator, winged helix family n=1 Tax=Nostocoides japonicum T1-X7 TaxID=1194083 RepID=A0A077M8H6_9MICO|nr:BTAD domain-containing putative transcriptional regulator [Tetrasphaera japonica]CCH80335.1 Transcriptional regulator, winged helix family [Tetrasphaera japonica T1-X7]
MTLSLRLLGPGSWHGEPITSSRSRVLLALLAGAPSGLSTERLASDVWPDEAPANPAKAVQVLVSRARAALGSGTIESTATGYRLAVPPDDVDVRYAARLARDARALFADGDAAGALASASEGLALWDPGPADPDVVDALQGTELDLAATSRSLRRTEALALATLDRPAEALPALRGVLDESPGDDVVRAAMLRAHAAVVGRASALELYEAHRRDLRDRLGMAPSPLLAQVQAELLDEGTTVRHGIRLSPNRLLGREADLAALRAMIKASRVTSIVGAGGLGKTRLAQELAASASQRAVHVVELAGVATGDGVLREVAGVVGTRDTSGRLGPTATRVVADVRASMAEQLSQVPTLLVLDNCEHVVDAVADLVDDLVATSPQLRVLTTSRTPLDIDAEAVYLLPQLDARTAADLFVDRARATRPDVELPPDVVARVCGQLDGLPLAIELAAAKVRVMSAAEVERRLDNRLALLRGTSRSAPARHQTLLAVIDWSWNLLSEPERAALRRLAAFQDGFTLEAAGVVVGDGTEDLVASLVTQSLLAVSETPLGARYRMLETVREFARMMLVDAGEDVEADERARDWAADHALRWGSALLSPRQFEAMDRLHAEEVNLTHALHEAAVHGEGERVAALFAALATMWSVESNHFRVVRMTPEVDALLYHLHPSPRFAEAYQGSLTILAVNAFIFKPRLAARSLSRLRRLPRDTRGFGGLLAEMLLLLILEGYPPTPESILTIAAPYGRLGDVVGNAFAAQTAENSGDLVAAIRYSHASLAAAESTDIDPWTLAGAHQRVAEIALQLGDPEQAAEHALRALPTLLRLGSGPDAAQLRGTRVLAALAQGDVETAERRFHEMVKDLDAAETDFPVNVNERMIRAEVDLARGRIDDGLRAYREAAAHSDGMRVPEGIDADWRGLEPWLLHTLAAAVAAHALHGRPEEVRDLAYDLASRTGLLLDRPADMFLDYPVTGAAIYALGLWLVTTDPGETAARLMACAVALGHARAYPCLALEPAGTRARDAVGGAYDEWVSSYAPRDRDDLREEAVTLLARGFGAFSPPGADS